MELCFLSFSMRSLSIIEKWEIKFLPIIVTPEESWTPKVNRKRTELLLVNVLGHGKSKENAKCLPTLHNHHLNLIITVVGGYSDTLGDRQKCHFNLLSI